MRQGDNSSFRLPENNLHRRGTSSHLKPRSLPGYWGVLLGEISFLLFIQETSIPQRYEKKKKNLIPRKGGLNSPLVGWFWAILFYSQKHEIFNLPPIRKRSRGNVLPIL